MVPTNRLCERPFLAKLVKQNQIQAFEFEKKNSSGFSKQERPRRTRAVRAKLQQIKLFEVP